MNSMKIGTYQMDTTFGLYLPEYTIPAPAVQTNFVKIIGRDGSVDLSNALGLHYDSRTWSLDFKCFDPTVNWHTLSSQVMNAIHGKRLNFEFDDDPNYFWTGRVSVQNYVSNHGTGTLKVTIVSDPFKYAKLSTIVTKTASTGTEYTGSMVTFNNGLIYDLSADIEPIQDLHGYSSPWPAGGGKNKLSLSSVSLGGDEPRTKRIAIEPIAAGTYKMSGVNTGTATTDIGFQFYDAISGGTNVGNGYLGGTLTLTGEAVSVYCYMSTADYNNGKTVIIGNMQIEAGNSITDYAPYENICPISGRTGLSVYRTGKNLLDQSAYDFQAKEQNGLTYTVQSDGTIDVTGTATAIGGPSLISRINLPNGTYTYLDESSQGVHCAYRGRPVSGGSTFSLPNPFTVDGTFMVYINMYCKATGTYNLTVHPQIELGSTATTYEPYNGSTYSADWTSPAGTVYGGTLDVVTGVLTVDRAMVDMGTLTWTYQSEYQRFRTDFALAKQPVSQDVAGNGISSMYAMDTMAHTRYTQMGIDGIIAIGAVGYNYLYVVNTTYTDATTFKSAMNGQTLCYELATPITYQLTPQEIEALVGTNNVWSDGGNVTVAVVTPETLTNNGRAVVPTLTASADMVLKWGNYSASVQQGTSTIPQLILENGANLIYIIGTGSISFTWQEESL